MLKEKDLVVGNKYINVEEDIYTIKYIGEEVVVAMPDGNRILEAQEIVFMKSSVLLYDQKYIELKE